MKTYQTNQIKNVCLMGNSGSGKTILAETILFNTDAIQRRGEVESKNTVSDFKDIEQTNGNSIFSSVMFTEYNNYKINILDNPGLDDFVNGVISSLRVSESGVMLINAGNGVEVGTTIHSRHAERFNKPMVFGINQLDHEKANFDTTIEQLKEHYPGKIVITQYPVNAGPDFNSIIDLLAMKMYEYSADGKFEEKEIPDSEKDRAEELHAELIEKTAETDETLMEKFFEEETLTEEEMQKGLNEGVKNRALYPVVCLSAKKNVGINRLLDFITNVTPSPSDMPGETNSEGQEIPFDSSGTPAAFVFKTSYESHVGEVYYMKIISGKFTEGMDINNVNTSNKERLSQIYVSLGKTREKISEAVAGDIIATVKMKGTKTGHTLLASGNWTFPKTEYPEPKFRAAIRPINDGEEEKLGSSLTQYQLEDPTIQVEYSKELKQIIIHGQGEYHLDILKWHLDNIYKVETEYYPPKIPYRETITKPAQADYRHKKQSGGAGQFGEVHMIIEPHSDDAEDPKMFNINGKEIKISIRNKEEHPLAWGGKLVFYNCIVGGSIDARFLPAILKGVMEKIEEGPLTGSYARDIRVYVYDGKMHPVDSNEISFKLAGRNAFSTAFKNAGPKIMEPIYDIQVLVPSDAMGDVMSDLQGRRAIVQGMSSDGGYEKISAKVPLSEMGKYSTALNSLTSGRAMFNMQFSEYQQVPPDIQENLIKEFENKEEEE